MKLVMEAPSFLFYYIFRILSISGGKSKFSITSLQIPDQNWTSIRHLTILIIQVKVPFITGTVLLLWVEEIKSNRSFEINSEYSWKIEI